MSRSKMYIISYDNFYMSSDITTLEDISILIQGHINLVKQDDYSALFICNDYEDYTHFSITKVDITTYEVTLYFKDQDTTKITLHEATSYIKD